MITMKMMYVSQFYYQRTGVSVGDYDEDDVRQLVVLLAD